MEPGETQNPSGSPGNGEKPLAVVVGAGATGSRILQRLAGDDFDIRVVDRDRLEERNLRTAEIYDERMVEKDLPKAVAAARALEHGRMEAEVADLNPGNAERLLGDADVVLDGTDNMETRFLVDDFCVKQGIPWVHAAALGTAGQVMPVVPGSTARFRCVFGGVEPQSLGTCDSEGIEPEAADRAAELAVGEARKILEGEVEPGLVRFDVSRGERRLEVPREGCDRGGDFPHLSGEEGSRAVSVCGENEYTVNPNPEEPLELPEIAEKLEKSGKVSLNEHLLRFDSGEASFTLFPGGRAIVEAESRERARSVYSRYVGL
ncbi:MAG: ThiF family adenylyltransferase [Candidatus Nanohaloarchaea archaeon]|nr:ThiF family adenylyltransferase [Candidatus Nanohaloarchaea archaeon]